MVERDRLLSGYWAITQSGVRIPPSPLKIAFYAVFFFQYIPIAQLAGSPSYLVGGGFL